MSTRRRRFVIACEVIDNVLLMKPHGMIPYTMFKHYGYDAEVVTYRHGEYGYLDNELKGLKVTFLRHWYSKKAKLPFLLYLARHARDIDVLMVYNIKKRPIYLGLVYKLFNPKGFLYAKADTSSTRFGFYVDNAFFLYRWYMRALGRLFLSKCDAVSVETTCSLEGNRQVDKERLLLMPCGFDPEIPARLGITPRPFAEKENLVLHVARMGIPQKNSEQLLDAIEEMTIPEGWRFAFVGSQTRGFRERVERFRRTFPEKAQQVDFHEHVADKAQLYHFYNRAKIFCLPSKRETFGNVLTEAQFFGNVIVGSDHLPSVRDLIDDGRAGVSFSVDDRGDLAKKLTELMGNPRLAEMSAAAKGYFETHLIWKQVAAPLHQAIQRHYGSA